MKMLKIFSVACVIMLLFSSCAANRIFTDIGAELGKQDSITMEKGIANINDLKNSWPYVYGQIIGIMGNYSYNRELSPNAIEAGNRMNELSKKETLTVEETGEFYGARDRFGTYWAIYIKDKYGTVLWQIIKKFTGFSLPF